VKIVLYCDEGTCTLRAVDAYGANVASAEAATVHDAVLALISKFADMQNEAIETMKACGLIRRSVENTEGLS
jgi:hypothetical protein